VALAVFAPDAMLYLYKASAVPDQIWVTRRFLVSTIPLLLLLALGFAAAVAERRSSMRFGVAARVGAMVFAISAIVYPLYTVIGVQSMSEERGFVQVIDDVCHEVGPHAAVVVLERDETDLYDDWVLQAIRSWCGAEVGVTRGGAHADALLGLAASWKAQGKPLFVVAKSDDTISKVLPDVTPHLTRTVVNSKFLEQTLTHRPDEYVPQAFALAVARVPAA
jgi:hypothetical protein